MNKTIKKALLVIGVVGFSCELAKAAVITQWSFDGTTPSTGTAATNGGLAPAGGTLTTDPGNSPRPTTGIGTALTLGMSNGYNGGNYPADDITQTSGTGINDYLWRVRANPTFADGTANKLSLSGTSKNGWATYVISGSAIGAPQYSQGAELDTSTVGYSNIHFSFEWYSTTQGIRDLQFQYNLDTSNSAGWTNLSQSIGTAAIGTNTTGGTLAYGSTSDYVFIATSNDYFGGTSQTPINVDLSSIPGTSNDPHLGVRLVSAFDDTGHIATLQGGTNDYASAATSGGVTVKYNNSSGNWRFDNLTFSGTLAASTNFSGPALTWNTTSGSWDTVGSNTVWLNTSAGSVSFANGSIATFGNVTSGTSTISVAPGGVIAGGVNISNTNSAGAYAFTGGAISGTGAFYLQPSNAGLVSISGTNSYTGGTQISGGTLMVSGDPSLGSTGAGSGPVILDNGSTLLLASSLASGRVFGIGSNGGVLNTNGLSFSTSGRFLGVGNYTQLGSGTVALSGEIVQLSGSTTLGAGTTLALGGTNGASLQGGGTINGNLAITNAGRVNFDSVGGTGVYGGSGQILVAYSSTSAWPVLSNSPSGTATGTNGVVTSGGTVSNNIVLNSGNLPFTKTDVTQPFSLAASNAFLVGFGGTSKGSVLAFTGNISGSSDVVLGSNSTNGNGGAGTLFLSGSNSWAGTTLIDGNGLVQLGSTAALPPKSDVMFGALESSSATLDVNGFSQTINSLSSGSGTAGGGKSTFLTNSSSSSATLTVNGSITPNSSYNGSITGNLALYKFGTGGLSLSGSNTYTGTTTIAQGTVTVSKSSALGVGPLALQSGGNLIYSGTAVSLSNSGASMFAGATLSSGGTANYGTLAMNSLSLSGGSLTYDFNTTQSDLISGTGQLDLTGGSLKSIVINVNITGQTFTSYPLLSFGSLTGFNSADFTLGSGTRAGLTYGFVQDAQNSNQIDLAVSGLGVVDRQALAWATSSGNWDTTSVNWTVLGNSTTATYADGKSVVFGEPKANNSVVTITGSAVTPSSLTFSNSSNSYTVTGGSIAGTTSLVKGGAGLVTLASPNSYSGGTIITGGTLATGAAGDLALGGTASNISLDNNATLQFANSGFSSSRNITINSGGGTIVASAGTATISGNLDIADGGSFNSVGPGTLAFTGGTDTKVTAGTGSTFTVQSGTLAVIPENFTAKGLLTVAQARDPVHGNADFDYSRIGIGEAGQHWQHCRHDAQWKVGRHGPAGAEVCHRHLWYRGHSVPEHV